MAAITISRQMGSLGCHVAQEVALRLGYRLVQREAINQAAMRAGAPEVALAVIDELDLLGLRPKPDDVQAYLRAISQVMHELADSGQVVIIGRAGQVILRGREDVFHVRVMAPVETRVQRLAGSRGISLSAAKAQVDASDHARSQYLRRYYAVRWDDPDLYDLVINTQRLSKTGASDLICQACEHRLFPKEKLAVPPTDELDCD